MILMPSCKEVRENLTEYMDGNLPIHKRMGIRLHLLMCKACRGLIKSLRALPKFAKDVLSPPADSPPEAKRAFHGVLERIKAEKPH